MFWTAEQRSTLREQALRGLCCGEEPGLLFRPHQHTRCSGLLAAQEQTSQSILGPLSCPTYGPSTPFIHSLLKVHRMSGRVIGAVADGAHSSLAATGLGEAVVLGGAQDPKRWMGGRREMWLQEAWEWDSDPCIGHEGRQCGQLGCLGGGGRGRGRGEGDTLFPGLCPPFVWLTFQSQVQ